MQRNMYVRRACSKNRSSAADKCWCCPGNQFTALVRRSAVQEVPRTTSGRVDVAVTCEGVRRQLAAKSPSRGAAQAAAAAAAAAKLLQKIPAENSHGIDDDDDDVRQDDWPRDVIVNFFLFCFCSCSIPLLSILLLRFCCSDRKNKTSDFSHADTLSVSIGYYYVLQYCTMYYRYKSFTSRSKRSSSEADEFVTFSFGRHRIGLGILFYFFDRLFTFFFFIYLRKIL